MAATVHPCPRDWIGDGEYPWPSIRAVTVGGTIVACYSLVSLEVRQTKRDQPYLRLRLCDRHGDVEARVWDDAEEVGGQLDAVRYVGVRGRVDEYRGERQIMVHEIGPVEVATDELDLFLPACPREVSEMERELDRLIATIQDAPLRRVLRRLIGADSETGRVFRRAPAAKRNHHAYVAGLLEHTLSVATVCDALSGHYGTAIDRDLLVTAALLHDIGKILEIGLDPGFPYTDDGKLLGHILLGLDLVRDAARAEKALAPERLSLLLHLIASHQGRYEWQSPREPRILEGLILHYADDLDAKMHQAQSLLDAVEEGWSRYDRSFGREFLRHRPNDESAPSAGPPDAVAETIDLFS